jgi:hypothetical protein
MIARKRQAPASKPVSDQDDQVAELAATVAELSHQFRQMVHEVEHLRRIHGSERRSAMAARHRGRP